MNAEQFGKIVDTMPDGWKGFLKTWGLQQFADAVEASVRKEYIKRIPAMYLEYEDGKPGPSIVRAGYVDHQVCITVLNKETK